MAWTSCRHEAALQSSKQSESAVLETAVSSGWVVYMSAVRRGCMLCSWAGERRVPYHNFADRAQLIRDSACSRKDRLSHFWEQNDESVVLGCGRRASDMVLVIWLVSLHDC